MWLATGKGEFGDVIERALYNGFLAGWSLDGCRYSYVNPLESKGEKKRHEWFSCACCPPNIGRMVSSLGRFGYGISGDGSLWINQYIGATIHSSTQTGNNPMVQIESRLPWSHQVNITMLNENCLPPMINLRIPWWAEEFDIKVQETMKKYSPPVKIGFISINGGELKEGDTIAVKFKTTPKWIYPHPKVKSNKGSVALGWGPLVYCLEGTCNNVPNVTKVRVDTGMTPRVKTIETKWGKIPALLVRGFFDTNKENLNFTATPYFTWNNEGETSMVVWMKMADTS
jgi:hypothetical protein